VMVKFLLGTGVLGWSPSRPSEASVPSRGLLVPGGLGPWASLPRVTIAQLNEILSSYSGSCGLGWDHLHPRQALWRPDSYKQAFLYIFMSWEQNPEDLELWTLVMLFLGKPAPASGVRPIVLASVWRGIWPRPRQPAARNWELSLNNSAFWGGSGLTCDRAGHEHSIVQIFARLKGFAAISGLLDVSKDY
jgi:hypothetical protein